MSENYFTAFGVNDTVNIATINERLAQLDAAIDTQASATINKVAILSDVKSTTTDGGSASATTWNARDLNTEVDPSSIVALSSNQFTPISGTFLYWIQSVGFEVAQHRLRLYNVTQTSVTAYGVTAYALLNGSENLVTMMGLLTANGTDAYRVDHYTEDAKATDGLGQAVGDGADEVYTQVVLIKIG